MFQPAHETPAPAVVERSPKVTPAGALGNASGRVSVLEPRRGSRTMRTFSEINPWVRKAIAVRKRAIGKAKWSIVRIDDPKAAPDPRVVKEATQLFNFVNDTRVNLNWLLSMLVEDILVFDAGCWYVERTAGGKIVALWPVPGDEIAPDANWDGTQPRKPRYYQYRDGREIASYLNDELIYMMQNPRSNVPVGFSPLESLFDTVESELYAAKFEDRALRETAPAGLFYLGTGIAPEQVEAFRDSWENDIAAQRSIAFFGGGDNSMGAGKSAPPTFIPFKQRDSEGSRAYQKWLVTKIAMAFEIDMLSINLSEAITKANGGNLAAKTDEGLLALGDTVAGFITREIVWSIDPSHRHGFRFIDLTPRDAAAEAKLDQALMIMGATTPNEVRAKRGLDPYPGSVGDDGHWSNLPWPFQNNRSLPPKEDVLPKEPIDDTEATDEEKPDPDDDDVTQPDEGEGPST